LHRKRVMQAIPVEVHRVAEVDSAEADLERVRRLANLLDSKFSVAGVKFGLDAIVGLVPVVGDVATLLTGLYPVYVAQRHNVSWLTRARMLGNLVVDAAVGAVPLVGDFFDVAFKSNQKNLKLLEKALADRKRPARLSEWAGRK
jgi:hypothetical protein